MDKFYKACSSFLMKNNVISKKDSELYEYAIKILVQGFINIIVAVIIGLFFNMLKECMCLNLVFLVLRKFTSGLHAKKYEYCLVSSIILIILSLCIVKYFVNNSCQIQFISLVIISTLSIWILAPIDNQNKKLSAKEKKIYKIFSIILSSLFLLMILYFMYKNFPIAYSFGIGLSITSLLLSLSYLNKIVFSR